MEKSIQELMDQNDLSGIESALSSDASLANANEGFDQPIHIASGDGKAEIVALLLRYGANVNAKDEDNRTPLHRAAQLYPRVAQVLLEYGADPNVYDDYGYSPIAWAVLGQQPEGETVINLLRAGGARYGLLEAVAMGDLSRVTAILQNDHDAVAKAPSPETLISMACLNGRYGVLQDRVEIVRLLLSNRIGLSSEVVETHVSACDNYGLNVIADLLRAYKPESMG